MTQDLGNGVGQAIRPATWASSSLVRQQQGTQFSQSITPYPHYPPKFFLDLLLPSFADASQEAPGTRSGLGGEYIKDQEDKEGIMELARNQDFLLLSP